LVAQEHDGHEEKHASGGQILEIWTGLRPTRKGVLVFDVYEKLTMKHMKKSNTCLSNFSKVWPPAGPPEAMLLAFLRALRVLQ